MCVPAAEYGDVTTSPSDRCDDNDRSSGSLSTDHNNSTGTTAKRKQRRYRSGPFICNRRYWIRPLRKGFTNLRFCCSQDDFHKFSTGRIGKLVSEDPLPGRVLSRGAGHAHWPNRSQSAGPVRLFRRYIINRNPETRARATWRLRLNPFYYLFINAYVFIIYYDAGVVSKSQSQMAKARKDAGLPTPKPERATYRKPLSNRSE